MPTDPITALLDRCRVEHYAGPGPLDEAKLRVEIAILAGSEWTRGWLRGWSSGKAAVINGKITGYVSADEEQSVQSLESIMQEAQARAWDQGTQGWVYSQPDPYNEAEKTLKPNPYRGQTP